MLELIYIARLDYLAGLEARSEHRHAPAEGELLASANRLSTLQVPLAVGSIKATPSAPESGLLRR